MKNIFLSLFVILAFLTTFAQQPKAFEVMDNAPDFTIVENGEEVKISDLVKNGPIVLTFYRGEWCKYCDQFLSELSDNMDRFKKVDAQVYAISPEKGKYVNIFKSELEANFNMMSDNGRSILDLYNVTYKVNPKKVATLKRKGMDIIKNNGEGNDYLPVPATYIIDRNMKIRFAQFDEDYTYRANLDEVFRTLRSLSGERLIEMDIKLFAKQQEEEKAKKDAKKLAKKKNKIKN